MKKVVIAIDGFAATGKGTLAQAISKKYNITYIDTGAFYRAISLYTLEHQDQDIDTVLANIDIKVVNNNLYLDGNNVTSRLRDRDVTNQIDKIVNVPEVREFVTDLSRKIAASESVVADGRDVGNNILPNADLKFLLVADEDVRAERRVKQYEEKGVIIPFETIKKDNKFRDERDALNMGDIERIVIDNTELTEEETLDIMSNYIDEFLEE